MLEYMTCEKCGTEFVKGKKRIPLCRDCAHEKYKEKMRNYMRNKYHKDKEKNAVKQPLCPDCGNEVRRTGDRCHECAVKHHREYCRMKEREKRGAAREEDIAKKAGEILQEKKAEKPARKMRVCRTATSIGGSINKDRDLGARAKAAAEERGQKARLALLKKVHAKYHAKKEREKERVMRMRMEQERMAEGWW